MLGIRTDVRSGQDAGVRQLFAEVAEKRLRGELRARHAAQQLGLPAGTQGTLITAVTPGGPAWEANLAGPGGGAAFIIQSVDGRTVRTEAELAAALRAVGAGKIATLSLLQITQGGSAQFVERVRLGGN